MNLASSSTLCSVAVVVVAAMEASSLTVATGARILKGAVVNVLGIATGQTTVNTRTLNASEGSITVKLREEVSPSSPWDQGTVVLRGGACCT